MNGPPLPPTEDNNDNSAVDIFSPTQKDTDTHGIVGVCCGAISLNTDDNAHDCSPTPNTPKKDADTRGIGDVHRWHMNSGGNGSLWRPRLLAASTPKPN